MSTNLYAVQHIRRMRGGSQAHLMRASDGHYFVVKFQNNPQHIRVLANEMFATRLAQCLGLPVPRVEVIEVSDWLV
jgi:glutathione synthase/RimK-type ligase-like ATP-grasp enzyme